ncbi:MAG: choice-of-anchor V domain-containing protein [Methanomassiliicoccus sp.]|nr:choice-of-anchor V domain-containing protein [Methanomassiliicoccus sp.]
MLAAAAFVMMLLIAPVSGWSGGGGNSNYQAGDCSCHGTISSATVNMAASSAVLSPGGEVTVTVTVTGGETVNKPLGAMILSKLSGSRTMPTDNGWTIVSDTFGTAVNYNEVSSYSGSATFTWTLKAPTTPGSYALYARMENSVNGVGYYKDNSAGLAFTVRSVSDGSTFVAIETPTNGSTLTGNVTVDTLVDGNNITSTQLLIDGKLVNATDGTPLSYVIDTYDLTDGSHKIEVIATSSDGKAVTREVNITVDNHGALMLSVKQSEWIPTDMIFLAIVGCMLVVGVAGLGSKKKWL